MFRRALLKGIKTTNHTFLTIHKKPLIYRMSSSSDSDRQQTIDSVAEALGNVYRTKAPIQMIDSSEDSDTESSFCVEDSFLATDVKVSVDKVGPLTFPIKEDVIKNLIDVSEKAKFGKGLKTVLDTSYRDTQTIPADKLGVEIDQRVFDNVLKRMGQELHIEEDSKLKIHLYNMLIYGPGQFFKRHRDTEKVPNMIASLIMVLPSPHKGGDLIIQHHDSKHKFFSSPNHEIIKCVAFYSDCFHEVKKVDEGYRVALTYNVEIESNPNPNADLMAVDENLKAAVNNCFEKSKSDKLVCFLAHQYTERSLRWNMLKGSDQICGKALLAVGKQEGYIPSLALADHHEKWPGMNEYDDGPYHKATELNFCVDENNLGVHCEKVPVSKKDFCFMTCTRKYHPYETEVEHHMGNEPGGHEQRYHRSAVVLWRNKWVFPNGYKEEFRTLHLLTAQPGMQTTLLKKLEDYSDKYFSSPYWNDASVRKMASDIMIYLNDKEMTSKILLKLEPSDVLDLTKKEWMATYYDLESWKTVVKRWESTYDSKVLLQCLLPFLSNYMITEDKDLGIAGYLLEETAKFFINPKTKTKYDDEEDVRKYTYIYAAPNPADIEEICSLLKICGKMGNRDLEEKIFNHILIPGTIYTASFLADLIVKMEQVVGDGVSNYANFKYRALNVIDAELEKSKMNPNDYSLPIKICCDFWNCKACEEINKFFASPTSMEVIISGKEINMHTYDYLYEMTMVEYWPIRYHKIGLGHLRDCIVTKLPSLLQDRQNYIERLIQAKIRLH